MSDLAIAGIILLVVFLFVLVLLIDVLWNRGNDVDVPQHVHSTPEEDEFRQAKPLRARLED